MSQPAIAVEGVSRAYPGVRALTDVSISIDAGEMVGLVGHNGAGKSTLTRIIGGVERPDAGVLRVGGEPVAFSKPDNAIAAGICVVPQHLSVVPALTVAENIGLGLKHHGGSARALRDRVRDDAARLGIDRHLNQKVRDARPSTQRLVMIARAVLRQPKAILLDEPTAALHPSEVEHVFSILEELRRDGMAILFISHRLDEVLSQTSRVVVMRQGRVVARATSSELTKHELGDLIVGRALETQRKERAEESSAPVVLRCQDVMRLPRVRCVSLEVRRGEVVGLAGLNGAGCSDLLRLVAGLERSDDGEITMLDRQLSGSRRASIEAGIAYLPDDRIRNGVVPDMTVAATVTLANDKRFRLSRFVPVLRRRRELAAVNELLAKLDFHPPGAANRKMKQLSGGNQQKALMARALLAGADVYLFDEPTEGVDVGAREDLHRAIRQLAADGAAVIVASSESEELVRLADRVVVMHDGVTSRELTGSEITDAAITHACLVG